MLNNYLDKNINLRFRIKIGFDCSSHSLFEMQRKLSRFVVSRSTFPFTPTECGHTILTVDHRTVVGCFSPIGSNLNTNYCVILNKNSYRNNVMSVFQIQNIKIYSMSLSTTNVIQTLMKSCRTINNRTHYQSKYVLHVVRKWPRQLLCCPVPSTRCRQADWIHPSCTVSCATRRTSDRRSAILVCSTDPSSIAKWRLTKDNINILWFIK